MGLELTLVRNVFHFTSEDASFPVNSFRGRIHIQLLHDKRNRNRQRNAYNRSKERIFSSRSISILKENIRAVFFFPFSFSSNVSSRPYLAVSQFSSIERELKATAFLCLVYCIIFGFNNSVKFTCCSDS